MVSLEKFEIKGHEGAVVPNTFYKHRENHKHLAILLPGMGYTCQMPLLYYTTGLLLEQEANVFRVEYNYSQNEKFLNLPYEEKEKWLLEDVQAALQTIFGAQEYEKVTLIGKSLGTLAMAHLLRQHEKLQQADAVWLTPLFQDEEVVDMMVQCHQRSLYVTGTVDSCYVKENLEKVRNSTKGEQLAIKNADHSLEIKGNILDSARVMEKVLATTKAFLNLKSV
jgi:predicted alpha/beta hydrolase family esterase